MKEQILEQTNAFQFGGRSLMALHLQESIGTTIQIVSSLGLHRVQTGARVVFQAAVMRVVRGSQTGNPSLISASFLCQIIRLLKLNYANMRLG